MQQTSQILSLWLSTAFFLYICLISLYYHKIPWRLIDYHIAEIADLLTVLCTALHPDYLPSGCDTNWVSEGAWIYQWSVSCRADLDKFRWDASLKRLSNCTRAKNAPAGAENNKALGKRSKNKKNMNTSRRTVSPEICSDANSSNFTNTKNMGCTSYKPPSLLYPCCLIFLCCKALIYIRCNFVSHNKITST